jgi:hypothetical protein
VVVGLLELIYLKVFFLHFMAEESKWVCGNRGERSRVMRTGLLDYN